MARDIGGQLRERVAAAYSTGTPLCIVGGNTKSFLGGEARGEVLSVAAHRGIVSYEPAELVLTARAGTLLNDIEVALSDHRQMLPFEPPHFGANATLGGTIACGLSGPRRPYAGAARDFVLGMKLINGRGETMRFGGQVMKNVAGFDVSRLMAGAMGTLGVILEISLKVLPRPECEMTLVQEWNAADAVETMNHWAGRPFPLSASCYDGDRLHMRLSGTRTAVDSAKHHLGGESVKEAALFWENIREQRHGFFAGPLPLWRLSLPPATPPSSLPGKWLLEWGGAQRWLKSDENGELLRRAAAEADGHATLFRVEKSARERFHPLPQTLVAIQRRLKLAFDPKGILNPGRLFAWC
jgi:glycolate dehydrogenase FAD-binding subunit